MEIRKSRMEDIERIMCVIHEAQESMRANGIPQWQDGYPNEEVIFQDIQTGNSYVLVEDGNVIGTAYIVAGHEPNYDYIEEGKWLNDHPYVVVHRIAISKDYKGKDCARQLMAFAESVAGMHHLHDIRIDTHHQNLPMRKFLSKLGYHACGTIYLKNGDKRIAYQKSF